MGVLKPDDWTKIAATLETIVKEHFSPAVLDEMTDKVRDRVLSEVPDLVDSTAYAAARRGVADMLAETVRIDVRTTLTGAGA